MRLSRTVSLGEGRFAQVSEARAVHLRRLLELLPELSAADPLALIARRGPELVSVLEDCVHVEGSAFKDLTLSEAVEVAAAWWGLHSDFFVRALARLGLAEARPAPSSSGGPSPASATPGTPPPGTTG